jgi:hypothetical protein
MAGDHGRKEFNGGKAAGVMAVVALVSAGVLEGCATFSRDGGFGAVEQAARERLNKEVKWPRDDGERGMAEMGDMEIPLPDNTLPMMTGQGPFGPLEMGGMFTVVKIREGLARGDFKDPGWYKHPKGSVAYEWKGALPAS